MKQVVDTEYIDMYNITPQNFWVALEHIGRYEYVAWFAKKRKLTTVLDAACSNGFGCQKLAQSAKIVVGVDANQSLIDEAKNRQSKTDSIDYHTLNFDAKNLSEALNVKTFDAIVCFETLEHIKRPQSLLAEFKKMLSGNGRILLSVPSAQFEPLDKNGQIRNPHHRHLFTQQKLNQMFDDEKLEVEQTLGQSGINMLMRKHNTFCSRHPLQIAHTTQNFVISKKAISYYTYMFAYPEKDDIENSYARIYVLKHK